MNCKIPRKQIFRKIDGELSESEIEELDLHLERCNSCRRDYELFTLHRRITQTLPPVTPSPYFFPKLWSRIQEEEAQGIASWLSIQKLARQIVPALAGITLALLSIFAYTQMQNSDVDHYRGYDRIFVTDDQSHKMLVAEQTDITYESVLAAIASR